MCFIVIIIIIVINVNSLKKNSVTSALHAYIHCITSRPHDCIYPSTL